jgi:hypothetical protein
MTIECDRCQVRGIACGNCAVTAIMSEGPVESEGPGEGAAARPELGAAEVRALTVLANAGLIPPLRYAPSMAKAS